VAETVLLQLQLRLQLLWPLPVCLASGVALVRRGALEQRNAAAVSSDFEARSSAATEVANSTEAICRY